MNESNPIFTKESTALPRFVIRGLIEEYEIFHESYSLGPENNQKNMQPNSFVFFNYKKMKSWHHSCCELRHAGWAKTWHFAPPRYCTDGQ